MRVVENEIEVEKTEGFEIEGRSKMFGQGQETIRKAATEVSQVDFRRCPAESGESWRCYGYSGQHEQQRIRGKASAVTLSLVLSRTRTKQGSMHIWQLTFSAREGQIYFQIIIKLYC